MTVPASGTARLATKLSGFVLKDTGKVAVGVGSKVEGTIANTASKNPMNDWKYVEGEYSQKPTDAMNVEVSANGKYDANGLPYKDTKPFVKQEYVDILSDEAKTHILYGDSPTSGGHMYPGNPGKSTFPKSWSADKIVHEIGDITTAPDTQWYAQSGTGGLYTKAGNPARWAAYEVRDGVRIRVIYEPANGKIITSFPDSTPVPSNFKPISK